VVLQAKWEDNLWEDNLWEDNLWEVTLQWEEVSDRWDLAAKVHQAKAASDPMLHPTRDPYSVAAQSKILSRSE
jgi:hypothetical protein